MMSNQEAIQRFWQAYLESLPPQNARPTRYEAWGFGHGAQMADDLGALVVEGVKTATCSLLWLYEVEGEPVPSVGDYSIILDGAGAPICIIETTEVTICLYSEVDAHFAYDEGEGDRSLDYWRAAHWDFFGRECAQMALRVHSVNGRTLSEEMPLVCERFQVVYR